MMLNVRRILISTFTLFTLFGVAVPAVAQVDDPTLEAQVWNYATGEDTIEAYELFIFTFPESDLVALAQDQLEALKLESGELVDENAIFQAIGPVVYGEPLAFGAPEIVGKTFAEVLTLSPNFTPIEGLPEEYWKEQTCAGCHQWNRDDLCTQANAYIDMNPTKYQEKMHPFGGTLKINLRNWAQNDCR